jgi:tRNA (mo5U34)-methyltransferase
MIHKGSMAQPLANVLPITLGNANDSLCPLQGEVMSMADARIPPPPPGFSPGNIFNGLFWFQKWEMFRGVYTPGINSIADLCRDLQLPEDLSGKRVLDIGAWSGCLSFECERRGAREVIAVEPMDPVATGFYRLREALGSTRTHFVRGSAYDLNPDKLGHFDVVLFCGVLYHLRYPLLAIDNIRRVCRGDVFVETLVSDAQLMVPHNGGIRTVPMVHLSQTLLDIPLWQFYRHDELEKDASNWFGPNAVAVQQAFESAGFDMRLLKNWGRATFHGRVQNGMPEFLAMGGDYYECVMRSIFGCDMTSWHVDAVSPPLPMTKPGPAEPARPNRLHRWWRAAKRLGKRALTGHSANRH